MSDKPNINSTHNDKPVVSKLPIPSPLVLSDALARRQEFKKFKQSGHISEKMEEIRMETLMKYYQSFGF